MKYSLIVIMFSALLSCSSDNTVIKNFTEPEKNLKLIVSNTDISNPEDDRRCYYRVYINKQFSGRTTVGLESQKKIYETKLDANKHLIKIEKWVLDEENRKYKKLNNIEQPKPDFVYLKIESKTVTVVNIETTRYNKAIYTVEFK